MQYPRYIDITGDMRLPGAVVNRGNRQDMMSDATRPVGIYILDEQEIYREMYRHLLPNHANIEILRIAPACQIGLTQVVSVVSPDVILLSVGRLEADMIEELAQIRETHPRLGVVFLQMSYRRQDIELLRRVALSGQGGLGIYRKQALNKVHHLCQMIIEVSQGQVILDPSLAGFMLVGKPSSSFLEQLTSREMDILGLMAQGYTNAAIAATLYIDIKTVEHHLNSLYSKLKTNPAYNAKHLRVSAAKLYLETMANLF
jgi:DNA-binding NarL/FixJ family response regulator